MYELFETCEYYSTKVSKLESWKRTSRHVVHDGFLRLVQDEVVLPNGSELTYESLEQGNTACVLLWHSEKGFLILHHYRYVLDTVTIEIPMGGVAENETPEDAARREVQEETGFLVRNISCLGTVVPSNGQSPQTMILYFAEDAGEGKPSPEVSEMFETSWVTGARLLRMAISGEITDAATLVAIFLAHAKGYLDR